MISVTAIATDLERMGDHPEGIGRIVLMTQDEPLVKPLVDIPIMAERGRQMMNRAVHSFVNKDVEAAYAVGKADDEVDELYETV